jgi:protein SCO1/2
VATDVVEAARQAGMVRWLAMFGVLATILMGSSGSALAQLNLGRPKATDGMAIVEHLSETLPLDLEFVDAAGSRTVLANYFKGERPVILSLNYSRCPRLCNLQLGQLVESLQELDWSVGREFDIVIVSIDPRETAAQAKKAKAAFLKTYRRAGAESGVHFLTGREVNIQKLAAAVGFPYRYQPEVGQYSHPAVCYVCTPSGKLSRYLYGIEFPRATVRMSLLEASEGKIGTTIEQILMFCYHFDPNAGVYSVQAKRLASVMGVITVAVILSITVPYWMYDSRRAAARKGQAQGKDAVAGVDTEESSETERRSAEFVEVVS